MRIQPVLTALSVIILTSSCHVGTKESWMDTRLPAEKRAEYLLDEMTQKEKVAQLCSQSIRKETGVEEGFSTGNRDLLSFMKNGIGQIENTFDHRTPRESAELINRFQQFLHDSTRLKIPALIGSECLHGHAGYNSTIFPVPLAMACSWDTGLVRQVFDIVGREARLRGSTEAHTPVLDLGRDPRWGRIEETYGEDTYLVSQMAYAAVTGMQGGNTGEPGSDHIIASPKHFAGYGQVAGGRNFAPTPLSVRTLSDEVLPPFKKAITEAKAQGIMASHCDIDGIPAHANQWLLTDLLRNKWGFRGMVVSDYMDIQRLFIFHHIAGDTGEAAEQALQAGVDLDLPVGIAYRHLDEVISENPALGRRLDESVKRILTLKFKLGLFENPFVDPAETVRYVGNKENTAIAQKMANESIVLLKNLDHLLPLNPERINSIAVIGPNAASEETGVYSVKNDHIVSILDGIKRTAGKRIKIRYTQGCKVAQFEGDNYDPTVMKIIPPEDEAADIGKAVSLARESDITIVCVGGMTRTSQEAIFRKEHKGDRMTLGLLGNQQLMLKRLMGTGKPVIVVLMGGKPYAIPEIAEKADAILSTFYLGQQNGVAVANVLFGKVNPGGKLSISFPRAVGQIPVYYSQKSTAFYKDYLEGTSRPLYPFGYGLSYTSFGFSDLQSDQDTVRAGDEYVFSLKVKNKGRYAGSEVVQIYYRDLVASVTRPERLLVRFRKVFLKPGEERTIRFSLIPSEDLAYTGPGYSRITEPGEFLLQAGNSSENILLTKSFWVSE